MKLKPHEILNHLGFDIDEEGVYINENDAFYCSESLRLVGKTLNVDNIPEKELSELRNRLSGLVSTWTGKPPGKENESPLLKLKVSIQVIMQQTFKYSEPK